MLVLNTNKSNPNYLISNSFIGNYPDIENCALLAPDTAYAGTDSAIADAEAIETVGGTKINRYVVKFTMPEYYHGLTNSDPVWGICMTVNCGQGTKSIARRFWLDYWFEGGEIVWEEVIFWGVVWVANTSSTIWNNSSRNATVSNIVFTVQMLHTDWTLTQIASRNNYNNMATWYNVNPFGSDKMNNNGDIYFYNWTQTLPEKVAGTSIVAQAGDRLVLDISCDGKWFSNAHYTGIFFGYKYTATDAKRFTPTQVSVR